MTKKDGTPKNTEAMKPKHGPSHPWRRQNDMLKDYTLKSMRRKELEKKSKTHH